MNQPKPETFARATVRASQAKGACKDRPEVVEAINDLLRLLPQKTVACDFQVSISFEVETGESDFDEFVVVADVSITHRGFRVSSLEGPAEGPETEIESIWLYREGQEPGMPLYPDLFARLFPEAYEELVSEINERAAKHA